MLYHLNYWKHWRLVLWNVTQIRLVTIYWRLGWATYLYLQGISSHSSWTILKMELASSLETVVNNYHIWRDTINQNTLICINRAVKTQNHFSVLSVSQPVHTHTHTNMHRVSSRSVPRINQNMQLSVGIECLCIIYIATPHYPQYTVLFHCARDVAHVQSCFMKEQHSLEVVTQKRISC